ncbi:MAG: hypothetical protein IH897_08635 [Planctomycetes bacterium]|nr:hypothetical protein [Planctomycetota bacterium]
MILIKESGDPIPRILSERRNLLVERLRLRVRDYSDILKDLAKKGVKVRPETGQWTVLDMDKIRGPVKEAAKKEVAREVKKQSIKAMLKNRGSRLLVVGGAFFTRLRECWVIRWAGRLIIPITLAEGGYRWYQIKKNDRYVSIARNELGNESRWQEIFELNKKKFPDPSRIRSGVRIKLPAVAVADSSRGRNR